MSPEGPQRRQRKDGMAQCVGTDQRSKRSAAKHARKPKGALLRKNADRGEAPQKTSAISCPATPSSPVAHATSRLTKSRCGRAQKGGLAKNAAIERPWRTKKRNNRAEPLSTRKCCWGNFYTTRRRNSLPRSSFRSAFIGGKLTMWKQPVFAIQTLPRKLPHNRRRNRLFTEPFSANIHWRQADDAETACIRRSSAAGETSATTAAEAVFSQSRFRPTVTDSNSQRCGNSLHPPLKRRGKFLRARAELPPK